MMPRRCRAPLILAASLLAACAGDRTPTEPPSPPARDPVLLVHGWNGSPANWEPMVQRFRADGWSDRELHVWSYNSMLSNVQIAEQLGARVDAILVATGAERVDIVSHSMGGLSSRHYVKFLGGDARVDAWLSIAGPNHGSQLAAYCASTSCVEMRPGSDFLRRLNEGDETPGAVRYATWWSPCDEAIEPTSSVLLAGAQNTQMACLGHLQLLQDAAIYEQVRGWITAGDP